VLPPQNQKMKKHNLGADLIEQTRTDEEKRMNNTKVDVIQLETPREEGNELKQVTTYEKGTYPNLEKGLFVDFEKRQRELRPKNNPNRSEEDFEDGN